MKKLKSTQYNLVAVLRRIVLVTAVLITGGNAAKGLDLSTYAAKSRLSTGNWVKVSVTATGMHCISEPTLRSWGFADPSKVKIYGYGGKRLPESLDKDYIDDVPQTPSEYVSGKGIYFYADGPLAWVSQAKGYYRPANNPYSDYGYYFLSDSDSVARMVPQKGGVPATDTAGATDTYYCRVCHEVDEVSPGEAGFLLLGEDFRYSPSNTFTLATPELISGKPVKMEVSFVSYTIGSGSTISLTVNNKALQSESADNIGPLGDTKYGYGIEGVTRKEFATSGNTMKVGITYKTSGTVKLANLNYISVNYARPLRLPSEKNLDFTLQSSETQKVTLSGVSKETRIWDVTSPLQVKAMNVSLNGNAASWESEAPQKMRTFAAWEPDGSFPAPVYVDKVRNQNLHAIATPDMVIFTPGEWRGEAERLAKMHGEAAGDTLDVLVLTPQQIYNEFSSGTPDAQAFRKILKMFYDRGKAGSAQQAKGKTLKYALFMSRPTYDPRFKTSKIKSLGYPMLPAWFTDRGLNDNNSYTTDDIFAFLEDGSGVNTSSDILSIAVGRLPVTSVSEAKNAVDKIVSYSTRQPAGIWRNNILLTADDGDNAVHMMDIDNMGKSINKVDGARHSFIKKVYIDAFDLIGGQYPEARNRFYRYLDEGAMLWVYHGHAAPSSLTAENLVSYRDLNEFYIRRWPVVMAFTCDFMRWDSSTISGAEILFKNKSGGVIAAMSATRPVYISENGHLSRSFGREMLKRDADGRIRTLGEIYREAKNGYKTRDEGAVTPNANKLRYVLLADPAMRLVLPDNNIVLDEIAGRPVVPVDGAEEPATLMARQQAVVKGHVTDPFGNKLTKFNGTLDATLFDAEFSTTSLGHSDGDKEGKEYTFDQQGGRLYVGTCKIVNGEFALNVSMPAEVSNNYRPAAFNLYAHTPEGVQATGVCHDLYVYGTDPDAVPDTKAPVIETVYLNHPTFRNGQEVNSDPMLIATVSDDRAINLSVAGVGHQMSLSLDGGYKTYNDVSDYFVPFADGTPGGTIAYPLEGIAQGGHTLTLRVWDNGPNSTESTVDFTVSNKTVPRLYEAYTDKNPVSDEANFYISHDRPDRNITVTIEVFNMMGRPVWQATETSRSDMFTSMPIRWDLHDSGGRRVQRGIYIYRATISDKDSGEKTSTTSRKLAVTGM